MTLRLAIVVSHPIQHFAPWHREIAKLPGIDLRVFFCCDWGLINYIDPEFQVPVAWDIPLIEGYAHEFLQTKVRPKRLGFWQVDNPSVDAALERFDPDVVKVFGYAHRTNWRVAKWTKRRRKPLLLYSDSNVRARATWWKRQIKENVVRYFYGHVDGALYVGDNNRAYHQHYGLPEERMFPGVLPIDRQSLLSSVPDRLAVRRAVREQHGIPQDAFVVMLCGKYVQRKRPLDLVVAAHSARSKGLPVWSLLVGEGPERERIEKYCRQEKVDNTVLTGFINQSNISKYYAAADIIAVTSQYDPHPLAVSEAASFGLPVIASDKIGCIGANDTTKPGINAQVYVCGDQEQLRDCIERFYSDRKMYDSMSQASLQISKMQDVTVAASQLGSAVDQLKALGPRWILARNFQTRTLVRKQH
jgi:glycosyltransferase involved in cell wall biosynthesis